MDELEPLASALRRQLGAPPEGWQGAQRARLREVLRAPPRQPVLMRFAPPALLAVVFAGALVWIAARGRETNDVERWLAAEEQKEPVRFDDGSSITLGVGARGRLRADNAEVHFDLHRGRASFDVVPGRKRTWTITAGRNEVRVVGTHFSVVYGPAETFEVEVERGIVSVRLPDRKASVELAAGDHLRGRPGSMEVAHAASRALSVAPPSATERENEPSTVASTEPPARSGPVPSGAPSVDWQARYRDGKYSESLALLRSSGLAKRLDELPPATLADVADAARLGGDPELAVRALNVLVRRFPRAPEARDGKFLLGRVHALRGDGTSAVSAFESYLETRSAAPYTSEAMGRLMELYRARGDTAKAREMARRYLDRAPDGPYRRLARSLAAE